MKNFFLKALVGPIAAGSLYGLHAANEQSKIAPRRREGRVQRFPDYEDEAKGSRISAGLASIGIGAAYLGRRGTTPTRLAVGALGAAALSAVIDRKENNYEPSTAIIANGLAAVGMLTAGLLTHKYSGAGWNVLKNYLQKSANETLAKIPNTLANTKKLFPLVDKLVSSEGVGIAGGLITFPVAHTLMVKYLAKEKRRTTDHGDSSYLGSQQDNNAGSLGNRKKNQTLISKNSALTADINFSGSVLSHYQTSSIFEDF